MWKDIILAMLWIIAFSTIYYKDGLIFRGKKWNFINCTTPSESRKEMIRHIESRKGTEYKLTVVGNSYGFKWR